MSLLSISKKILSRAETSGKSSKKTEKKSGDKKVAVTADAAVTGIIGAQTLMSEKALIGHAKNTLVIRVLPDTNKHKIAHAISTRFGVKVLSVRTANMNPKNRARGITRGKSNNWKKAYITVDDISKISGVTG